MALVASAFISAAEGYGWDLSYKPLGSKMETLALITPFDLY